MDTRIEIHKLDATDLGSINKIASWYNDEWNTPITKTVDRLSNQPNEDVLFQLILNKNDIMIATGGLAYEVSLLNNYPEYRKLGPWIALLYTEPVYRNQGFGKLLLEEIELYARNLNVENIYLYTFTAESLYKRSGWKPILTVKYKNYDTVIMGKKLEVGGDKL